MSMKQAMIVAGLVVATAWNASASIYTFSGSGGSIPDNRPDSGLLSVINVASSSFSAEFGANPYWVQNVNSVQFTIEGGWNGDYKAILTILTPALEQHGTAVLLNRMGQDGSHLYGYANTGMSSVVLDDTAGTAISNHPGSSYTSGAAALAAGLYAPQASVTFSSFEGMSTTPLGTWALYFTEIRRGTLEMRPGGA